MNSIKALYVGLTEKEKALVVFISTVLFAGIIFFIASIQMRNEANKAMKPYLKSQDYIQAYLDSLQRPAHLPETYFTLFKAQQKIMSIRKSHHLDLSKIFFRNYYGVLIVTMVFSCIGGVVLFLLVNKGWSGSTVVLKTLFLPISMILIFCGFFPLVFKQQENFNENIKYYMNYTKAELNIVDQLSKIEHPIFPARLDSVKIDGRFAALKEMPDSAAFFKRVDSMITSNHNILNNLTNYVLTIDANEIKSMSDIYKVISNSNLSNTDSLNRRKP
jgi:hypothetical protein